MKSAVQIWRKQQQDKQSLHIKGTILSWTRILVAPPAFAHYTPYVVVLVELENNKKTYGQLVDYEEDQLTIGMHVVSTLRRMGDVGTEDVISYGIKFKPLL
jgi:uncharacterized OB-fold protein